MLDAAQKGNYAYPAVNVTSITTINAALKAFSDAKSDGIIQVSTGGGQFASGLEVADAAFGAIATGVAIARGATDAVRRSAAEGSVRGMVRLTPRLVSSDVT